MDHPAQAANASSSCMWVTESAVCGGAVSSASALGGDRRGRAGPMPYLARLLLGASNPPLWEVARAADPPLVGAAGRGDGPGFSTTSGGPQLDATRPRGYSTAGGHKHLRTPRRLSTPKPPLLAKRRGVSATSPTATPRHTHLQPQPRPTQPAARRTPSKSL